MKKPYMILVAAASLVAALVGTTPASAQWRNVAIHKAAQQQPTPVGRMIMDLERVGRRVYAGYGDYTYNTGPIAIHYVDLRDGKLKYDGLTMKTEAIYKFQELSTGLVALGTDPMERVRHQFAFRERKWRKVRGGLNVGPSNRFAAHVFDVQEWRGELWAVGSTRVSRGAVWSSADNGRTWRFRKLFTPQSRTNTDGTRLYFSGVYNDEFYVQAFDSLNGQRVQHDSSMIFDGNSWREGPDLLLNSGQGYSADNFGNAMIWRTNQTPTSNGYLHALRGSGVERLMPRRNSHQKVRDYVIGNDGYVYALVYEFGSLHIDRSNDLDNWVRITSAPSSSLSIEVFTDPNTSVTTLYVGTRSSRIKYRTLTTDG